MSNQPLHTGAAYIRVSTDKQEELSPNAQKRLILDYAKKNDIIISSISTWKTAFQAERPPNVLHFRK